VQSTVKANDPFPTESEDPASNLLTTGLCLRTTALRPSRPLWAVNSGAVAES
jgi:hypothetical protein